MAYLVKSICVCDKHVPKKAIVLKVYEFYEKPYAVVDIRDVNQVFLYDYD